MTRNEENRNGTYRGAVGKVGSVISALYSAEKRENSQCLKWVKGQMHCSTAAKHTHTHTHCNHRDVCCVRHSIWITCSFAKQLLFVACFCNDILLQLLCGHRLLHCSQCLLYCILFKYSLYYLLITYKFKWLYIVQYEVGLCPWQTDI